MAEQTDILGTLKGGLGLAGKLAGKGFNEVSGLIKGDESGRSTLSGVYWQRGPWCNERHLLPEMDYLESQSLGRYKVSIMKRVTISKAERAFMKACGCCVASDPRGLEDSLREAVESDTQFADGYFLLGCFYLESDNADGAVVNFQKALLCQQSLGGKLKKHLPSFRMILPLTPSSAIVLFPDLLGVSALLALAQRSAGQREAAISTLEQLLGVMPAEPLALLLMSILHLECGQFSEVVNDLRDVLPSSTLQVANLLLLGYACSRLGDVATARDVYRSALDKDEYDPLLRLDLQHALETSGVSAQGELVSIRREYPEYVPFFERLGVNIFDSKRTIQVGVNSASADIKPADEVGERTEQGKSGAFKLSLSQLSQGCASVSSDSEALAASPSGGVSAVAGGQPSYTVTSIPASGSGEVVASAAKGGAVGEPISAPCTLVPQSGDVVAVAPPPLPFVQPLADGPVTNGGGQIATSKESNLVATDPARVADASATVPNVTPPVHVVEPLPPRVDGQVRLVCSERNLEVNVGNLVVIGREEGTLLLPFDSSVSRRHARLVRDNNRYLVDDLGSTNGTWLNGYRLTSGTFYAVNRGDVLQFGSTKFRML